MSLNQSTRISALAIIGLAGAAGGVVLFGQVREPPASAPAQAALFTDAQAVTGKALYDKTCAGCHGVSLSGGTAPPLTGPSFQSSWGGPRVTLDDLFFITYAAGGRQFIAVSSGSPSALPSESR
jgi:mono/diheme cytochrome c family protein